MKRVAKIAWSLFATVSLAVAFFLFMVTPARASHGGKNALGGRTIASIQEQEIDQKLLHFQLCYGVGFTAETATMERRRVCKVMVVHHLERAFAPPGAHFRGPVTFRCEDTVFVNRATAAERPNDVVLKPNAEFPAIERAVTENLETAVVGESVDRVAKRACEFLTDCKLAMSKGKLSFRKLASCLSTGDLTHRKILLDEVGAMVFRAKEQHSKILYSDLLEKANQ